MGEQFSSYILNLEAAYFSKLSVIFYQSTWHHIEIEGVDISLQSSGACCKALAVVVVVVMDLSKIYGILYDIDLLYVRFCHYALCTIIMELTDTVKG
jgi:hypothetical protein